jgi:ornithine decarboxylase
MLASLFAFQESVNRFPEFGFGVEGVFQERIEGRIKFHTYVVSKSASEKATKGGDRG